jgi:alcohol dehydrogenase (cytochrome c)
MGTFVSRFRRTFRMTGLWRKFLFGAGLAALCAAYATAQTELATGPFTAPQIEAGRKAYTAYCAACHQANLQGQGDALPLAGRQFMAGWGNRTSRDLYNLIHASMPVSAPNSLDDQTYASLTAFLLYANGAKPGPMAFLAAPPLRISLIANGFAPGDLNVGPATPSPAAGARPAAPDARGDADPEASPPRRTAGPAVVPHVSVAGTVSHYTPITDAILTNPSDDEWPMFRRNYQGWSYSPLRAIPSPFASMASNMSPSPPAMAAAVRKPNPLPC